MNDLFTTFGDALNPTADELKELGITRAIEHADRVVESWSENAYRLFTDFCKTVTELKTEDARIYAESQGIEEPPTKRAWGAITLKAARAGVIIKKGVVYSTNPKCHMGFTTTWEVVK